MILEAIVTTLNADGTLNVAPMGPRVEPSLDRFHLRPFRTSTTYANLSRSREGVLHVTDDSLLFAKAAIGIEVDPPTRPAEDVLGAVLTDACRYFEFRVVSIDDREERPTFVGETVRRGRFRDFLGFNRARHAVIEAAIVATRAGWLPVPGMAADFARYWEIIAKTGGPGEREAYAILNEHVRGEVEARREHWPLEIV